MISVWTLPTSSSGENADGSTSQQQLSALQTAHLTRLVSPRYANQRVQVKTALAMTISPACGMCVWWALWSVFFCREARPTNVCDHFRGFGSILCAGTIFWSDTGCFHTVAESPLALTALELRLPALKKKIHPDLSECIQELDNVTHRGEPVSARGEEGEAGLQRRIPPFWEHTSTLEGCPRRVGGWGAPMLPLPSYYKVMSPLSKARRRGWRRRNSPLLHNSGSEPWPDKKYNLSN